MHTAKSSDAAYSPKRPSDVEPSGVFKSSISFLIFTSFHMNTNTHKPSEHVPWETHN